MAYIFKQKLKVYDKKKTIFKNYLSPNHMSLVLYTVTMNKLAGYLCSC